MTQVLFLYAEWQRRWAAANEPGLDEKTRDKRADDAALVEHVIMATPVETASELAMKMAVAAASDFTSDLARDNLGADARRILEGAGLSR